MPARQHVHQIIRIIFPKEERKGEARLKGRKEGDHPSTTTTQRGRAVTCGTPDLPVQVVVVDVRWLTPTWSFPPKS